MLQLNVNWAPADGINLEFYHFLCHESLRLRSLCFDLCQHFSVYALLKFFALSLRGMVTFTPNKQSGAKLICNLSVIYI